LGKVLSGGQLAGGNPTNKRVENDFYATDPEALRMLMREYEFNNGSFLEPCVGNGNLARVISEEFEGSKVTGVDLVDRGYDGVIVSDFLEYETDERFDNVITNPPFSLAREFAEKGLELLRENGKMALFLRIQFLEGVGREEFFNKYPPRYVYVFRKRMATWNNGEPLDPKGKNWSTTMCHAWFIWEKGFKGEPIIRWL